MPKRKRIAKRRQEPPPCLCSSFLRRRRVFTYGTDGYSIREAHDGTGEGHGRTAPGLSVRGLRVAQEGDS